MEESKIAVPGNWYQIDFHVHSPGSFDFKGPGRDESGYIWLLEQAIESNLDIIVITDHNDIKGYLKFKEIEEDLRRTKRTLERTNSSIPDSILSQISLFEQITILPGVELDVHPNIHLLIVFDPEKADDINCFLSNAGYTTDIRGEENTSKFGKWTLDLTLQESEKFGAITLAAHVDSDKGLYEVTKKWGQDRISAFCNEYLYGMEFINPIAKDQIENIMKSPDYTRNSRLAFVQSSDFHGKSEQKIGERRTFVRMDNVDKKDKSVVFQTLKKALRNPDEFISAPGRPELKEILRKLTDKPSIEAIKIKEDEQSLLKLVCSFANTEDGTIVIGRNAKGNWTGQTENSEKDYKEKIISIISTGLTPHVSFSLQVYPYYGNNYVATIRVKKHSKVCALCEDDKIYILKSGKLQLASSKEIIDMAESLFLERYAHLSITSRLSDMSRKLLGTEDSIDILPIVRKIENNSIPMKSVLINPDLGIVVGDDDEVTLDFPGNGYIDGNIITVSKIKPRFDSHYLRISAPIGIYAEESEKSNDQWEEKHLFSGEKIILAPGGGIYYDIHENIIVTCDMLPPIVFTQVNKNYSGSLRFVAIYLKSSVAIWYAERCLGSCDIWNPSLSGKLPIPNKVDLSNQEEAERLLNDLLKLEYEFLDTEKQLYQEFPTKESKDSEDFKKLSDDLVERHNIRAGQIIGKIDKLFYNYFGLSSIEINMIEQLLKSTSLANFNDIELDN